MDLKTMKYMTLEEKRHELLEWRMKDYLESDTDRRTTMHRNLLRNSDRLNDDDLEEVLRDYRRDHTVYGYWEDKLGEPCPDNGFIDLESDSPCGKDCIKAIDATVQLLKWADRADSKGCREEVLKATLHIIQIFWYG